MTCRAPAVGAGANLPDVVLMDTRTPRMDGLEVARRIKARCPGVSDAVRGPAPANFRSRAGS